MSNTNENLSSLRMRDKELVALGAAIASNCIPCVEFHIPLARKAGLSDLEIRAAVELADKVRRVPADKVLQTAFALLETRSGTVLPSQHGACSRSDDARNSAGDTAVRAVGSGPHNVRLDNKLPQEDNAKKGECCSDDGKDSKTPA